MSKIFFISDTHFDHENVIRYCNRPFSSVLEMNSRIIENWNKTVSKDDVVYFLGDFALGKRVEDIYGEYSQFLNGTIYFLRGNHDRSRASVGKHFNLIDGYFTIEYKGYHFILSHYPLFNNQIPKGFINIHGHIHNNVLSSLFDSKIHINVSSDVTGFTPLFVEQIIQDIEFGKYYPKFDGIDILRRGDNMRKLATVQKVLAIDPIPDADTIEVVTIKGWKVVVKKGEFKVGDMVVYFEIDSLIPNTSVTNFLMKKEDDTEARLKTIKLRGQVSQGLILPISAVNQMMIELDGEKSSFMVEEGEDLSDLLHIEKYEPPVSYGNEGRSIYWPFSISKTDEERIQNIPDIINKIIDDGIHLCVSVKLDGTSMTVINQPDGIHVAGRNNDFDKTDDTAFNNKYWSAAKKYNVVEALERYHEQFPNKYLAVQGELVGPGIQGNKMNLSENHFYIFNLFESEDDCGSWNKLGYNELIDFCDRYGLDHVPYIATDLDLKLNDLTSVEALLKYSEGTYRDNAEGYFPNAKEKQQREGLVFRSLDHKVSFKVVNNLFLLKGGD